MRQWLCHCSGSVSAWESLKALVPALRLRNFSPSKTANIEATMPKLMIAIGLPNPHSEAQDEGGLDRERDDSGGDDSDLATEIVMSILNDLKHGKAAAVRNLRAYMAALEEMCQAFVDRDYHRVGEAASDARDCLHEILS